VQALPLVSTFWGVILFGEYRKSSKRTYLLLAGAPSMSASDSRILLTNPMLVPDPDLDMLLPTDVPDILAKTHDL
jgi:hypothetical protein